MSVQSRIDEKLARLGQQIEQARAQYAPVQIANIKQHSDTWIANALTFNEYGNGQMKSVEVPLERALERIARGDGYGLQRIVWADGTWSWAFWRITHKRKEWPARVSITSAGGGTLVTCTFTGGMWETDPR